MRQILAKMCDAWHASGPTSPTTKSAFSNEHYKTLFRTGYSPASMLAFNVAARHRGLVGEPRVERRAQGSKTYVKFHLLFAVSAIIAHANNSRRWWSSRPQRRGCATPE